MKTLLALVTTLTCFVQALGSILPELPMGSEEKVLNHCLRSGDDLIVFVYQYNEVTGEESPALVKKRVTGNYKSKEALEESFRSILNGLIQKLIAGDYGQKNNGLFTFYTSYSATIDKEVYLEATGTFSIKKNLGVFTPPDLSHFKMGLPDTIPYKIEAAWIRSEIYDIARTTTRIDDSNSGSELIEVLYSDLYRVSIPTEQAIGAGSGYKIKISAFVNQQFVVYENGLRIEEKEPEIKLEFYPSSNQAVKVSLKVTGGEIGRTYCLLSSTNLLDWNDAGLKHIVTPNSTGTIFTVEPCNGIFYKLHSTEKTPEY